MQISRANGRVYEPLISCAAPIEEAVPIPEKPVLTTPGGQRMLGCAGPGAHLQIHLPSGGKEHKVKHPTKSLSLLSEHRLHAYTVAATAAGVGVLCLTQATEAKVVYTPRECEDCPERWFVSC
jgi:hypothetical protein